MSKKMKIFLCIASVVALLLSFFIGFFVGQNCKKFKSKKEKMIKFYNVKKYRNKEATRAEKDALKMFVMSYEECLKNNLTSQEEKNVNEIQQGVLKMSENNEKISFKIGDVANTETKKLAVRKVKKCQKNAYEHMTKTDKRMMKSCLKKMKIQDIVAIFHGIK